MKKVIMFIGAVVFSTTLFAQDSEGSDNPWTLEGAINYNSTDGLTFNSPSVRARYFVKDNIAIRADLSLAFDDQLNLYYENMDGSGAYGSIGTTTMSWSLGLGGEYHLSGTEKLSPYFSAGLMFGGASSSIMGIDIDELDEPLDDAID
ncbi:MAG: TonB-dependent receptor, partial [Crocinitomicaceae bacterium]|nr:TonB-dependent receptor [Crocinitomicaceae bacterium]